MEPVIQIVREDLLDKFTIAALVLFIVNFLGIFTYNYVECTICTTTQLFEGIDTFIMLFPIPVFTYLIVKLSYKAFFIK